MDSLGRKYHTLHRMKIPSGEPNIPEEVRATKQIKHLIGQKCNLGNSNGLSYFNSQALVNTNVVDQFEELAEEYEQ